MLDARDRDLMTQSRSYGLQTAAIAGGLVSVALLTAWFATRPAAPLDGDDTTVGSQLKPIAAPPTPSQGFVGSQVCAECHKSIADQFQQHPMARSLELVSVVSDGSADSAQTIKPNSDVTFHPPGPREYRVETTTEVMRHHELARDRNGQVIYDQSMPVAFAVGSGRRGRSYLLDRQGWLSVSPIAWYANGARWDLSPGYAPGGHQRFDRRAELRCLFCHSGRLNHESRHSARLNDPPFQEVAIGCERCHGPGTDHVSWHRDGPAVRRDTSDPIVNPATLEPALRESVCNQCHLQGDVEILRYGRAYRDFRPGEHLGETWTTFVGDSGVSEDQQTVAISHVQQMRESRCYTASDGRLGCISCHDPHRLPSVEERLDFYRTRCLECHAQRGCRLPLERRRSQQNSCIACHMTQLEASDVPHTAQTDHRLRRPSSQRSLTETGPSAASLTVFDQRAYRLPASESLRARLLLQSEDVELEPDPRTARQVEIALRRVWQAAPDDIPVIDALALMLAIQRRGPEAVALWKKALDLRPDDDDDDILVSLAGYFEAQQNWSQAAIYFQRLARLRPWQASIHGRHSFALGNLGKLEEAVRAAELAVQHDPSNVRSIQWLGELHRRRGQESEHRKQQRMLDRLRNR